MTADNEQVTSADGSEHAATKLHRGADSTSRAEPGTGPATGVSGRGSSVPAVRVEGVVKRFGATVALDGAGLVVPAGMVFGLLGPERGGQARYGVVTFIASAPETVAHLVRVIPATCLRPTRRSRLGSTTPGATSSGPTSLRPEPFATSLVVLWHRRFRSARR